MKLNLLSFFIFPALLFFAGCSIYHVDSEHTTLDFYAPKDSGQDIAYMEKVDKPVDVIGIVSVVTERSRSQEEVLAKMRFEAAVLGGDAITSLRQKKSGPLRYRYTAKVIVFK